MHNKILLLHDKPQGARRIFAIFILFAQLLKMAIIISGFILWSKLMDKLESNFYDK